MASYKDLNDYEVMYLIEENDEDANEVLFEKYRPLILSLVYRYRKEAKFCGLEMDDVIQEAYLGLCHAIQTYDPNNDVLFYTYAIISIRSKILNALKVKNSGKHKCLNQSISLFQPLANMEDGTLLDSLEDKNADLPDLLVEENEMQAILRDFILSLDFSQSCIFELKMNGFQNKDIMQLLDMPLKLVSNISFRIRKKLRIYLMEKDLI